MLSMKFPHLFLRPEIIITFLWGLEWSGGAGATPLSAEFWFISISYVCVHEAGTGDTQAELSLPSRP